ncbi:hypothetical protein ElyMa_002599200 [Elysia marginata]|uniref:Uncharacterized protein n=1 Tax=Elysia marginata TaxID=1093978 RepID=A0AAV4H1E6_9GAST|nr:hypothetical protein ElyMa_002599200 [Elysia marginata]
MCRSFHFGQRSSFRMGRERGNIPRPNASGATTTSNPIPARYTAKAEPTSSSVITSTKVITNTTTPVTSAAAAVPSANKSAEPGLLATIFSKIRQWLQSKRRYEVSPGAESRRGARGKEVADLGAVGGGVTAKGGNANGARRESVKEDYLIISKTNNYHPELKRSEATNPHSHNLHLQMTVSKSSSAISSLSTLKGNDSASASPILRAFKSKNFSATAQSSGRGTPHVDINIELVDTASSTPVELKSHFKANPLRLVTAETPPPPSKTAMMTPATRMLSRSQQLRQSRNKYMKLLQKTGQLSPGRLVLTLHFL